MSNNSKRYKIALVGSGNIGGTLAHMIALEGFADVILLDKTNTLAQGKALDIGQAMAIKGQATRVSGTCNYEDIKGSDVVIITAGIPRQPGMSRDDLLSTNSEVMKIAAEGIKKYAPDAFVIIITNPLDAMVYAFQKHSGLPHNKVVGMAGVLDSGRFRYFLSIELNIAENEIQTMVLGGHGDTMVPLIDATSVAGMSLKSLIKKGVISQQRLDEIIQRTRDGGAEIVKLLVKGSAFYAPATAAIEITKSYLFDQKRLLSCAAHLNGEYGERGIYVGVPVIIGAGGIEKIIEFELTDSEKKAFDHSVDAVKELVKVMEI